MSTTVFPLKWPKGYPRTDVYKRKSNYAFKGLTAYRAHRRLVDELRKLDARDVVVSSNAQPIRGTGYIGEEGVRSSDHPGVAVYFTFGGRQMTMAQDLYVSPAANMNSLALAIEALRAIERHGGARMMQQAFEGFARLPPPDDMVAAALRPWREVLQVGDIGALPNDAQRAIAEAYYKREARKAHPDVAHDGGQAMAELNVAIEAARQELT